jgi:hypothetical protein
VTPVSVSASKTFSYVAGPGQAVADDTARLVIAKRLNGSDRDPIREATLLFPRPGFGASCVLQAQLTLHTLTVAGAPADVGVFPSAALALARGRTPEIPSQLLDNQPSGRATVTASGSRLRIDVTDLVRAWLRGVFPSQGATVPRTAPLLLTIQPPDLADGRYSVAFAGVGGHDGPVLAMQNRC